MYAVDYEITSSVIDDENTWYKSVLIYIRDDFRVEWSMSSNDPGDLAEMLVSDLKYLNELYWQEQQLTLFDIYDNELVLT